MNSTPPFEARDILSFLNDNSIAKWTASITASVTTKDLSSSLESYMKSKMNDWELSMDMWRTLLAALATNEDVTDPELNQLASLVMRNHRLT